MAVGWFLCPYKRLATGVGARKPVRYCAMRDVDAMIRADGGEWTETEVLGDRAIVKVRASAATLATIAGTPTFRRLPLTALDDPLSSLTAGQRNAIKTELLDAGYSLDEVTTALPDLATVTLRQVLSFLASRRMRPRYDANTDTIILDGPVQNCRPVEEIDGAIV